MMFYKSLAFFVLSIFLGYSLSFADDAGTYTRQVKPTLQARCYACHGVLKQNAGLRLDTVSHALQGGESGPSVIAGNAIASHLMQRVTATDNDTRMPPEGEPLKPSEIEAIQNWINAGAVAPADDQPELDPLMHWSFQSPTKKPLPTVPTPGWESNPIDRWIASEQNRRGISPQPDAPKRIWLRRVYLDLIGLPPSLDEQRAFDADNSAEAYEAVVSRLLDSPQYGERWGRHWMDIWRYSDAWGLGEEMRNSQRHLWRWRDWIIESLNDDHPYDQMLREMLAADELYSEDPSRLRATGFLARNYFKFNRTTWMDETIEHTSKSMLGLTMNCVKCHDHKYDPITQNDYYQMRAIFEPYQIRLDLVPGELNFEKNALTRVFDCNLQAPTYLHVRGDDRNPDKKQSLPPGLPKFLVATTPTIEPVTLPAAVFMPNLRPEVSTAHRLQAAQAIESAAASYKESLAKSSDKDAIELAELHLAVAIAERVSLEARLAADANVALVDLPQNENHPAWASILAAARSQREAEQKRAKAKLLAAQIAWKQGAEDKKAELQKGIDQATQALDAATKELESNPTTYRSVPGSLKTLESNLEDEASRTKPFPRTSTGRRKMLANWIGNRDNPLTARVAVNHIWARHFGQPLVSTVFDFGRKGKRPTHPELLDWLAVDLMDNQWSMKRLHRMIVTSKTYRMTSSSQSVSDQTRNIDPENQTYWRFPGKRMESQLVRDSLLAMASQLDRTIGGPSISHNESASRRRSIYFFQSHNEHNEFLSIFDDANVQDCYRRTESIVPQQSLALANSKLIDDSATAIATHVATLTKDGDASAFIANAFAITLGTDPSVDERKLLEGAYAQLRDSWIARNGPDESAAQRFVQKELVRTLLNHNDFLSIR